MSHKINFKFEKFHYRYNESCGNNFVNQRIQNFPNLNNFRNSQVVEMICSNNQENILLSSIDDNQIDNYIVSAAVFYCPSDWTDRNSAGEKTSNFGLFDFLNLKYLEDLQNKKAMLLIDQSVEGYHRPWLWNWFHGECARFGIPPDAIIYISGSQACTEDYIEWYTKNKLSVPKLKIMSSTVLSVYIYQQHISFENTKFNNILEYKKNNKIMLYDCINLKPRYHRIINCLKLLEHGLLPYGKVSMPSFNDWTNYLPADTSHISRSLKKAKKLKPLTIQHKQSINVDYNTFIIRILDDVYLDTWVSLITESTYYAIEHSIFISEKTFKPIACMQPFIIVGSKHTLKYLRKLGYKTFSGFIDESYDDCDDDERFDAIIRALQKIHKIPDKVSWLTSMRDILEHNYSVFLNIGNAKSDEYTKIIDYYNDYFNGESI